MPLLYTYSQFYSSWEQGSCQSIKWENKVTCVTYLKNLFRYFENLKVIGYFICYLKK